MNCLILGPTWLFHGQVGPHQLALEAGFIVGLFLLLPRRPWSTALAAVTGVVTVALAVLGLGDTAARMSLARPLNLYLDVRLVGAVSNLLDGTMGEGRGPLILAAGSLVAVALAAGLFLLLGSLRPSASSRRARMAGVAMVVICAAAIPLRWIHPRGVALALPTVQLAQDQLSLLARMLGERQRFAVEMAASPAAYSPGPGLLRGLGGRDVILAFIESYGVSAVNDPRYAPVVRPRLEAMADAFAAQGIHVVSGLLEAPSQGGMSWLGRGSILSGLWLENQLRYDLLMASERRTLVDDFDAAGYRTAAVMPAITLAWPEGERLGYDDIWAFKDIDYAGPPLNWVTMPDQFTWSFLERAVRSRDDGRPLFAEVGLISSHAPWTPILEVRNDWDAIGDGSVFQPWANAGEPPEELWLDADRVREHYALAVGYATDVLTAYAVRYLDDGTLLIALGDHQPAPLITGDAAGRAVPIHVMATDPDLLEPFLAWGFRAGALPDPSKEVRRMDAFRHWFVEAFSDPRPAAAQ